MADQSLAKVVNERGILTLLRVGGPATRADMARRLALTLGGAMRPVLDLALPALREDVAARIIPGTRIPEVLLSTLGEAECAVGAACIAHHKAFDLSNVEVGMPPPREAALG